MPKSRANEEALAKAGAQSTRYGTKSTREALHNREAQFLDLPYNVAWQHGIELTRVIVRQTEEGWQTILKGNRGRQRMVAYINAETFVRCIEVTAVLADSRYVDWYPDKKPPYKGKK